MTITAPDEIFTPLGTEGVRVCDGEKKEKTKGLRMTAFLYLL
jgi:hypothetical protein